MNEIEIKFLEVDPEDLGKKLTDLGAKKISDQMLEEWIFWREDWKAMRGRVRIRSDAGKVQLAYKETTGDASNGNLEIEFVVSDAEQAKEFMLKMGAELARHQQKRRVHYELKNIAIDIDFWPLIPPYVEIEGDNLEELEQLATQLQLDGRTRTELDAFAIYQDVYHIAIGEMKELVFEQ
jgi:adenylate cyclase class 2